MLFYSSMRGLAFIPLAVVAVASTRSPGYGPLPKPATEGALAISASTSSGAKGEIDALKQVLKLTAIAADERDSAGRPGFATDQGRLYAALGAPTKVLRYNSGSLFCPLEIWHYQAIPKLNINHSVEFLFFKDENTGKYKMYAPSLDAIQSLLRK
jgi:hypothetical protein